MQPKVSPVVENDGATAVPKVGEVAPAVIRGWDGVTETMLEDAEFPTALTARIRT